MELHNLKPAKGSIKKGKRVGRGEGSKRGGTSTRGHKGAKSRSGYSRKIGFEGGQQPLQRRVPKFGFTNPNRKEYQGINLDRLQDLVDSKKIKTKVDKQILIDNGLAKKKDLIKILGRGELKAKLDISVDAFSASAKIAIEKAGGTAITSEK
jgi:large subunit ribosomal protein L15|tara:strand:- start:1820 stop:2275 length:456 start_codon:yes stop_codon:yes gene_type:complete